MFSNTRNDNTSINDEITYTKVFRNTNVNGTCISNNLILPFIEVLHHSYMERLSDEDILSHHGPEPDEADSEPVDMLFEDDEHDEDLPEVICYFV